MLIYLLSFEISNSLGKESPEEALINHSYFIFEKASSADAYTLSILVPWLINRDKLINNITHVLSNRRKRDVVILWVRI